MTISYFNQTPQKFTISENAVFNFICQVKQKTKSLVTSLQWLVYFMDIKHRMQLRGNGKHAQDSVGITDLLNSLMHYAETAL